MAVFCKKGRKDHNIMEGLHIGIQLWEGDRSRIIRTVGASALGSTFLGILHLKIQTSMVVS